MAEPVVGKKPWLSKTLITNFIVAVVAIVSPQAQDWIVANPEVFAVGFSVINAILRLVTKEQITIA